jgi:hypothetical protein
MSTFDPTSFMNTTVEGSNSTQYSNVPEGEYRASIKDVVPAVTQNGKAYMGIQWIIDDETARQETGRAEPQVRQTVWLDVTESGGLDFGKGKNVALGKLRDAVNQNVAGQPWMPGMLVGQVATVRVKHSIDKRDNVTIQAEVAAVARIS